MIWIRLEKRVMVPLPCTEAREFMIRNHLEGRSSDTAHYGEVFLSPPTTSLISVSGLSKLPDTVELILNYFVEKLP
jgi:hypothetical protein